MNWRFCPRCETQLDDETGICPACRWDPLDVPAAPAGGPEISLMERYRGTEYDSYLAAEAVIAQGPTSAGHGRQLLLAGVLGLVALYGGIVAITIIGGGPG